MNTEFLKMSVDQEVMLKPACFIGTYKYQKYIGKVGMVYSTGWANTVKVRFGDDIITVWAFEIHIPFKWS